MELRGQDVRDLKEWGTPIRDELQAVFTEPVKALAERIDVLVGEKPEIVNDIAGWPPVDCIPYSCHEIPPNLYQHTGVKEPFIPETDDELERFMDGFWQDNLRLHASTPGFHAHATFPEHRANLTETLRRWRQEGREVDLDDWNQYQEAYEAQLRRGFYTLGHNAAVMNIRSIFQFAADRGTFDQAEGRHASYLLASLSSPHRIGLYLRVPEGGYGNDFNEGQLRAASFIINFIEQDREFNADMWQKATEHYDILSKHTLRATVNKILYGVEESASVVVQEGEMSVLAMTSLATAQRIPGLDEPKRVMPQIEKDDLLNKLTLILPLGVAGATSAFGIYFPGMLRHADGHLSFDDATMRRLSEIRDQGTVIMHEEWSNYHARVAASDSPDDIAPPVRTGLTCPVAGSYRDENGAISPGAISTLTGTHRRVHDVVEVGSRIPDRHGIPWQVPRIPLSQTVVRG